MASTQNPVNVPQSKNQWMATVIACLVTAIVVGGGMYVWMKKQAMAPAPQAQPTQAPAIVTPTTLLPDLFPEVVPTDAPSTTTSPADSAEIEKLVQGILDPTAIIAPTPTPPAEPTEPAPTPVEPAPTPVEPELK